MRKMESLINRASNDFLCQSHKNMKENLSFLQKELLGKDGLIKPLLETQIATPNSLSNLTWKPVSLSTPRNCSIQNEEEEDMEK